jgi:uncharacterized protein
MQTVIVRAARLRRAPLRIVTNRCEPENAMAIAAWKFVMPEEAAGERAPGPQITVTGGVELVSGAQAVRQAVLMLLSTRPGERLMRPEYGCALDRVLFLPNDDTTAGIALHYVRVALERWEPRIDIVRLDATRDSNNDARLLIELRYRDRRTREPGMLTVPLDLNGA